MRMEEVQRSGTKRFMNRLGALLLAGLLLCGTAMAEAGNDLDYVWIQDPWTGE